MKNEQKPLEGMLTKTFFDELANLKWWVKKADEIINNRFNNRPITYRVRGNLLPLPAFEIKAEMGETGRKYVFIYIFWSKEYWIIKKAYKRAKGKGK